MNVKARIKALENLLTIEREVRVCVGVMHIAPPLIAPEALEAEYQKVLKTFEAPVYPPCPERRVRED